MLYIHSKDSLEAVLEERIREIRKARGCS
jgi:hypothetical protein